MPNRRIYLGFEVECGVPSDRIRANNGIGGYHSGRRWSTDWEAQSDGSVNTSRAGFHPVELVSRPFQSTDDLARGIDSLMSLVGPIFIELNNSMGCHVHIGAKTLDTYMGFLTWDVAKAIDAGIHSKIEDYDIIKYHKFKSHYYRNFAREITEERRFYNFHNDRYTSWNMTRGQGVELRSFNLMGCEDWTDLRYYLLAADEVIRAQLLAEIGKGDQAFTRTAKQTIWDAAVPTADFEPEKDRDNRNVSRLLLLSSLSPTTIKSQKIIQGRVFPSKSDRVIITPTLAKPTQINLSFKL